MKWHRVYCIDSYQGCFFVGKIYYCRKSKKKLFIVTYDGISTIVDEKILNKHFYTLKQLRILKLKQLNENSL